MSESNSKFILVAYSNKDFEFANRIITSLTNEVGQSVRRFCSSEIGEERNAEKIIENSSVVLLVASDGAKNDELLCEFAKKTEFVNKDTILVYEGNKPIWVTEKWRIEEYEFHCFSDSRDMSEVYSNLRDKIGETRLMGDPVGKEINILYEYSAVLNIYRIKDGKTDPLGTKFRLEKGKHLIHMHFKDGYYQNFVLSTELNIDNPTGIRKLKLRDDLLKTYYKASKNSIKSKLDNWEHLGMKYRKDKVFVDFFFSQYNFIALICAVGFVACMVNTFFTDNLLVYTLIILSASIIVSMVTYYCRFSNIRKIIDDEILHYKELFHGISLLEYKTNNCFEEK